MWLLGAERVQDGLKIEASLQWEWCETITLENQQGPPFWSFCFMSCHTGFLDYLDNLEVFYLSWWRHLHNNKMSSAACWFCTCARSIGESLSQWSNKRTELEGRLHQLTHLTKLSYSFPYFLTSNEHSSDSNCNNWKNNFPNSNLPFDGIWLRKRTCTHQLFSPRDLRNVSLRAWPWDKVGFKPLWFFLEHQVKQNRYKHATKSHLGECCIKINLAKLSFMSSTKGMRESIALTIRSWVYREKMSWIIICSLLYVNIISWQQTSAWQTSASLPWRISFPTSLNAVGSPFCRTTTPETPDITTTPLSFPGRHPVAHAKQPRRPRWDEKLPEIM